MSTTEVFAIKRAWQHGVRVGAEAALEFVPPSDQSEGNTWRELAAMEYEATNNADAKVWHHVWVHGFVCGYYTGVDRHEVPEADLKELDLARHMQESMAHLI